MASAGATASIAVLVARAEISNLLKVILGSSGATMRELALGAAAVEGGMGEGPCLAGTGATLLARSLRLSHERSGASGRDCRWRVRNAIWRCLISPSTASCEVRPCHHHGRRLCAFWYRSWSGGDRRCGKCL